MPDRVDAAFLSQCRRPRVIACALKGFDNFDVGACTAAGVWLAIVPDLLTEPTAELAVGLAIGLGRMIRNGDAIVRSGAFEGWRPILYGAGLDGSTVTIVGMGHVGRAIARRLSGFGCRILGVDPQSDMPSGVVGRDLNSALADSDFVILAAPLTPATHHLIGRDAIAQMKPRTLLINVGRGSVVDETAVADALESDALGGYAADVFEMEDWALPERPMAIDPRLREHPRTLFTPASRLRGRTRTPRDRAARRRQHRRCPGRKAAARCDQRANIAGSSAEERPLVFRFPKASCRVTSADSPV
jgi:phosphonate dehydrogenase